MITVSPGRGLGAAAEMEAGDKLGSPMLSMVRLQEDIPQVYPTLGSSTQ